MVWPFQSEQKHQKGHSPYNGHDDDVIPLFGFDDQALYRKIIMLFGLRFDEVLDPDKLHLSLESLLAREGWRKLGARLRLNKNGKLEHHIPQRFDVDKRPAVAYSHERYAISMAEHPIASQIPRKAPQSPALVGDPDAFISLMRRPGAPSCIADYLNRPDEPQLGLHIVSFEDGTLVSLQWCHVTLDVMARHELLAAWSAVLHGQEPPKPVFEHRSDPLGALGTRPTEPYLHEHLRMGFWASLRFILRFTWDVWWNDDEVSRMVCLPAAFVQREKTKALQHIAKGGCGPNTASFVSEGDVVSAIAARLSLQNKPRGSQQTVALMNMFGLRWLLADEMLGDDKNETAVAAAATGKAAAYVHNAAMTVTAFLTVSDIRDRPLALTALAVRRSLAESGTRQQIEARRAADRDNSGLLPPMFGDGGMQMVNISNWTKARFFEVDFSGAVMGNTSSGTSKKGKPSMVLGNAIFKGFSGRHMFPVMGKDASGNYWMMGVLTRAHWKKIEESMESGEAWRD